MLATNIAAMIVTKMGGSKPQSLQQVYNNYIFLKIVAVSGFLPISFTLFVLHIAGMTSWYLILISCSSIFTSVATLSILGTFTVAPNDDVALLEQTRANGPAECGFHQPWLWCCQGISTGVGSSKSSGLAGLERQGSSIFAFCVISVIYISGSKAGLTDPHWMIRLLRMSRNSLRDVDLLKYKMISVSTWLLRFIFRKLVQVLRENILPALGKPLDNDRRNDGNFDFAYLIITIIFRVVFLAIYATFFRTYMGDLAWFAKRDVYNKTWNFGQIVAISIWAPAIAEWIHLEIRGIRRGLDYKLLLPYKVTKVDPDTSDRDEEREDHQNRLLSEMAATDAT